MENWKEDFKQYLSTIEEFLTSVLLEETNIEIASADRVKKDLSLQHMKGNDIFLYARDQAQSSDVIIVLAHEWFGLLSSIMLGIEEKEKNETTIELLEEFSTDLSDVLLKSLEENDVKPELDDVQVLSKSEMQELLAHGEYWWANMKIEGLADSKVRAEFLLGDPETEIVEEEPAGEDKKEEQDQPGEVNSNSEEEEEEAQSVKNGKSGQKEARQEEVISARHIEFAEFSKEGEPANGEPHSMDLLKDVELDVSVELGRIELPLGKVLQLAKGSVIELEKLAGEPVDILVNGNRIALGEVVVIDEHFGVRISSLVTTKKRLAKLSNGSS